MGTDITVPDINDDSLGPAMKRCTQLQRRFVMACLMIGGGQHKRAAALAGYKGDDNTLAVMGFRTAHISYVQQAILEEAAKRLGGASIEAVNTVLETMSDAKASRRERLTAAQMIMDRVGLHSKTEHNVNVTQDVGKNTLLLEMIRAKLKTNPDYVVPEPLRKMLDADATPKVDAPIEVAYTEVDPELDALLEIE